MKSIKLKELIDAGVMELLESKIEDFLDDLGNENMEGWGDKGRNTVVVPKGHSKFDRKKVDKLADKHGLKFDSEDDDAIQYKEQ